MRIQISVRDYRGIERADIELDQLALVAGNNEQGKSSLAQAVRSVLAGAPIPIEGVAKKDAQILVRDGAEKGHVKASIGEACSIVEWPKAIHHPSPTDEMWCSPFAVGLRYLFELDDKERANVLAGYIDSQPDASDVHAAMADAEYSEKSIDQVWQSVSGPDGWDGTYKKAKEHGTKLKGQWEATTGEAYGAKKAETWKSPSYPNMVNTLDPRGGLEGELARSTEELERLIGLAAVAKSDIAGLRAKAGRVAELEKQEVKDKAEKDKFSKAYDELTRKPYPQLPQRSMTCPKCETPLTQHDGELIEAEACPTAKDIADAKQAIEQHRQALDAAKRVFEAAYDKHQGTVSALRQANAAKTELDNLRDGGGEIATDAQVTEARTKSDACQRALSAYDATNKAAFAHSQIVKNALLVDILAPEGLRKRKLVAGLKSFNDTLEILCKHANWPAVRLDESLKPHYGTRPLWAASASGQWRASVVVQVAMAKMEGSAVVVIDEADILDQKGRNSLFNLLKATDLKAVVCMTVNKADLVPDLEKAKLGRSYWVQAGVVHGLKDWLSSAAKAA